MKALWGMLLILALHGTAGHATCDWSRVLGPELPSRLNQVRLEFQEHGLRSLEKALTGSRVVFQPKAFRFQHDVTWKIRSGQKILVVRDLPWATEEQRQRTIWNVARALYQIELDRNLFSGLRFVWKEMKQPIEWQDEDELMGKILVQWPLEVRAAKKARVTALKADLKLLGQELTMLKDLPRGNWERYFRKSLGFLMLTLAFTAADYAWSEIAPAPPVTLSQSEDRALRWHNDLVEKYQSLDPTTDEAKAVLIEIRDLEKMFEFKPCQQSPTDAVGASCGVDF